MKGIHRSPRQAWLPGDAGVYRILMPWRTLPSMTLLLPSLADNFQIQLSLLGQASVGAVDWRGCGFPTCVHEVSLADLLTSQGSWTVT